MLEIVYFVELLVMYNKYHLHIYYCDCIHQYHIFDHLLKLHHFTKIIHTLCNYTSNIITSLIAATKPFVKSRPPIRKI